MVSIISMFSCQLRLLLNKLTSTALFAFNYNIFLPFTLCNKFSRFDLHKQNNKSNYGVNVVVRSQCCGKYCGVKLCCFEKVAFTDPHSTTQAFNSACTISSPDFRYPFPETHKPAKVKYKLFAVSQFFGLCSIIQNFGWFILISLEV